MSKKVAQEIAITLEALIDFAYARIAPQQPL
jgi:hypothetical protein